MLHVPAWSDVPNLVHGFCGRRGGCSHGPFAELNLSFRVGDRDGAVRENRRRLADAVGALHFAIMAQVHGARVATVEAGASAAGEADAQVTRDDGIALSILTADCVPILLVAPRPHVVAAVHAGWRGTVAGIAARAVETMAQRFGVEPREIRAALGPAIGGCCYQVEHEIVEALTERWGPMPDAAEPQTANAGGRRRAMLDLRRANARILLRAGLDAASITSLGPCTRCTPTEYFSYRAASAGNAGGVTGRQLSFIGWQKRLARVPCAV